MLTCSKSLRIMCRHMALSISLMLAASGCGNTAESDSSPSTFAPSTPLQVGACIEWSEDFRCSKWDFEDIQDLPINEEYLDLINAVYGHLQEADADPVNAILERLRRLNNRSDVPPSSDADAIRRSLESFEALRSQPAPRHIPASQWDEILESLSRLRFRLP